MQARMLFTGLLLAVAGSLFAADTTITIPGLECPGCARKIASTLKPLPGVADVLTDIDSHTAIVKPRPNAVVSPRAMWEALEKIKKTPTRLAGPGGTFTERPPQ